MKKTLVMAAAAVLTGSMAYPSLAEEYVFEMAPVVVTANRMNENLVDARADIAVHKQYNILASINPDPA